MSCHDNWRHSATCASSASADVCSQAAVQVLCCILLIFVTRLGWLESETGAGRGNPGFDSPGERDQRQGPSHANPSAFYLSSRFLDTSISFYWNTFSANFSVGGRLCPVTIIREGSPVPVMCGAQSSESPRSFLPLAIISQDQRPLTGSHSLHSTGHMRTQTTHHPVQTDNVARLSRHWHHHLETELDTRRFSASQTWSQRCVKWPGDWWACLNVNHLSNDFPDLHMNWISNGETLLSDLGVKLKLEQINAISSRMIDASVNVLIFIFLFNVVKLILWATDD